MKLKAGTDTFHIDTPKVTFEGSGGLEVTLEQNQPGDEVILTFDGAGITGGGGGGEGFPLFIQDTAPVTAETKYLWIDTTGGDLSFNVETGV